MSNQTGGFPPVLDVAVPFGLTLIAHWLADKPDSIKKIEKTLSRSYDQFVGMLPTFDNASESTDSQDQYLDEYESQLADLQRGGDWTQLISDMATPAILTASAHYLASDSDAEDYSGDEAEYTVMKGGAGMGMGMGANAVGGVLLQTIEDLIVPLGLMTGAHLLAGRNDRKVSGQRGGNVLLDLSVPLGLTLLAHTAKRQTQKRSQLGGSGLPVIGDTYLGKWLADAGQKILTPSTLLPLGVVFVLYMGYRRYLDENDVEEPANVSTRPNILDMAQRGDLEDYTRRRGIKRLEPEVEVPFALAMGPDVFHQYMEQNRDEDDDDEEVYGDEDLDVDDVDESDEEY